MTPAAEKERERVVAISQERGEFVTEVDGYVYWWPSGFVNHGFLTSYELRWLADELDKRNAEWDAQVRRDLAPAEPK